LRRTHVFRNFLLWQCQLQCKQSCQKLMHCHWALVSHTLSDAHCRSSSGTIAPSRTLRQQCLLVERVMHRLRCRLKKWVDFSFMTITGSRINENLVSRQVDGVWAWSHYLTKYERSVAGVFAWIVSEVEL